VRQALLPAVFVGLVVSLPAAPQLPNAARLIQPCRADIRTGTPVIVECAAAALAERNFLTETQHRITRYLIAPMRHTDTAWQFMILLGDLQHPPPPGGQYMAIVDRTTGKVELIPGE
jgi:hypothetical protein